MVTKWFMDLLSCLVLGLQVLTSHTGALSLCSE